MVHDVATLIYKLAKESERAENKLIRLEVIHGVVGDYEVSKNMTIVQSSLIKYNGITIPFAHYQVVIQHIFIEFLEILNRQNSCDSFAPDTSYIVLNVLAKSKIVATCKFVFKETVTQEDLLDYDWNIKCKNLINYLEKYMTFARDIIV